MTRLKRTAGLIFILSLAAAACGGTAQSLDGLWDIDQVADDTGDLVLPVDGTSPFLLVDGDQISGTTGCNSFSGTTEIGSDGGFQVGQLMSTLMGCDEARSTQEANINAALTAADSWTVDDETASLSSDGSVVMILTLSDTTLEGSTWSVTAINNGKGGVRSIIIGTDTLLLFEPNGVVSGTGGCNQFNGAYEVDGPTLSVETLSMTERACLSPEGVMDQEQQLTAALSSASTFAILGDTLNIRDAEGATQVTAIRSTEAP